jgi:hypothetical protein
MLRKASLDSCNGRGWKSWRRVAIADLQPSAGGGPRTSLRALLVHPPVTILIVTAGVAAANLTWLDPVRPCTVQRRAATGAATHTC